MSTTLPLPKGQEARAPRGRLVLWVCLAWTAWALIWTTEPLVISGRLDHVEPVWFREAATWALLTLVIFRLAERFPLRWGVLRRNLPVHLVAAVLVSFFSTTVTVAWDSWQGEAQSRPLVELLFRRVRFNATWYCYVLGVGLAVHYHRQARDRQRQAAKLSLVASELEARVARAQLDAARMRLQPELVYATLASVATLAPRDPDAADALTVRLADLLRMVTDSFGAEEVPLGRDAAYLQAWATVQHAQDPGPQLQVDLADGTSQGAVPAFLLQPLVVALVDGTSAPQGCVHVRAWVDAAELRITVDAPVGSARPDAAAVDEVRDRLRRTHGDEAAIEALSGDGNRAIHVRLPFRAVAEPEPALAGS
ncbi:MAG TPA: histidine kinase [Longimicrobium sp.]|nr:histidine kinase [Longimicrobium sp.]